VFGHEQPGENSLFNILKEMNLKIDLLDTKLNGLRGDVTTLKQEVNWKVDVLKANLNATIEKLSSGDLCKCSSTTEMTIEGAKLREEEGAAARSKKLRKLKVKLTGTKVTQKVILCPCWYTLCD
jgi:hypothetical protein